MLGFLIENFFLLQTLSASVAYFKDFLFTAEKSISFVVEHEYFSFYILIREEFGEFIKVFFPIKVYCFYMFIRNILFFNNNSISSILISFSWLVLLIFNDRSESFAFSKLMFCLVFVFASFLFRSIRIIYEKAYFSNKRTTKVIIISHVIISVGLVVILKSVLTVIKKDNVYLLSNIESIFNNFLYGLVFVLLGNLFLFGDWAYELIFYPIEFEFFVYRNKKYAPFIKVARCILFQQSQFYNSG